MSDTPDFDNMSQEEIMLWMETLAKRQGAYEGFTTSADMEVGEIDPNSVDETQLGPGYVPYGQKADEAPKAKPAAPAAAAKPLSQPAPVAPIPQPVAQAAPAAQAAPPPAPMLQPVMQATPKAAPASSNSIPLLPDGSPDLENATPEQLFNWMESLAKRQGATEGIIDGSMDLAEVDESKVDKSKLGPGYTPYGQKADDPAKAKPTPAATPPVAPPPAPVAPAAALTSLTEVEDESTRLGPLSEANDPLTWLGGLVGGDSAPAAVPSFDNVPTPSFDLPNLDNVDLSGLSAPSAPSLDWLGEMSGVPNLDDLGLGNLNIPAMPDFAAQAATPADDPMKWLSDMGNETPTAAANDFDVAAMLGIQPPAPVQDPALQALFDAPDANKLASDPSGWLDDIAAQRGKGRTGALTPPTTPAADQAAPVSDEEFKRKANSGQLSEDDVRSMFNQWFDRAKNTEDKPYIDAEEPQEPLFDPNAPAVQDEVPDWLAASAPTTNSAPANPAFQNTIAEPAMEMPDWLQADTTMDTNSGLEDIFASITPTPPTAPMAAPSASASLQLDPSDPWVEAFEEEHRARSGQPASVGIAPAVASDLPAEAELAAGELSALPSWAGGTAEPAAVSAAAPTDDMPSWLLDATPATDAELPDWLREANVPSDVSVPSWLTDTMPEETPADALINPQPAAQPVVQPVVQPVAAQPAAPRPVYAPPVARAPVADVSAALADARAKVSARDIDNAVLAYEDVVRSGGATQVVGELRQLVETNKNNPATYRVLGDALMRAGQLQEALETYRRALNML
jgi:hypothetical protein